MPEQTFKHAAGCTNAAQHVLAVAARSLAWHLCMLSGSPGSAYGHVATLRMQTRTGFGLAGGRALLGTGSDDDVDVDGTANGKRLSKHERRTRAMQVCS